MNQKNMLEAFQKQTRQGETPLLAYFWAPWCLPCRSLSPVVDQLGKEYEERLQVLKINADEQPELLRDLGIYGIPTLVLFQGGREAGRKSGAQSRRVLRAWIESALSGSSQPMDGVAPLERLMRLGAGVALVGLGWYASAEALLIVGALVAFSGVYDRCPLWQVVSARLKEALHSRTKPRT